MSPDIEHKLGLSTVNQIYRRLVDRIHKEYYGIRILTEKIEPSPYSLWSDPEGILGIKGGELVCAKFRSNIKKELRVLSHRDDYDGKWQVDVFLGDVLRKFFFPQHSPNPDYTSGKIITYCSGIRRIYLQAGSNQGRLYSNLDLIDKNHISAGIFPLARRSIPACQV